MQQAQFNPAFDGWRICGQGNSLRILTDDEKADTVLEAMGLRGRFHVTVQATAYIVTAEQACKFLHVMTSGKQAISEAQRAARAANANRARESRRNAILYTEGN